MSASDVPVREPGTRTRSGNTMAHTRAALLQATADCIARYGVRKTTMVDVASRSGVAKATLYNHFRTKDDVLVALVEQRVTDLVALAMAADGVEAALVQVAQALATNASLRKVAADEPAFLAALLRSGDSRGWQLARDGVAAVLQSARISPEPDQIELVLRWFTSQLMWPTTAGPRALLQGLRTAAPSDPPVTAAESFVPKAASLASSTLGWPA